MNAAYYRLVRAFRALIVCAAALCSPLFTLLVPQTASAQMFEVGEQLEYKVTYAGITLGTIKMLTEKPDTVRGAAVMKLKCFIDTAPGIPFVEFHSIFESWADKSGLFSHEFLASTKAKEGWEYDRYEFLYPQARIHVESGVKETKIKELNFQTPRKNWNDGLSLFFAAREMLRSKRNVSIPTAIMSDTSRTIINFKEAQPQAVEIEAVKHPIKTVYFNGEAKWRGIYGLEGGFEGWFSDDEARIPIRAKMKVIVGKVNIELVRWKRGVWQPPAMQ
jgi:hypothetical protein